jgi:hypothetical protein
MSRLLNTVLKLVIDLLNFIKGRNLGRTSLESSRFTRDSGSDREKSGGSSNGDKKSDLDRLTILHISRLPVIGSSMRDIIDPTHQRRSNPAPLKYQLQLGVHIQIQQLAKYAMTGTRGKARFTFYLKATLILEMATEW